ncbi:hypothetical protein BUALT_Bualt03G0071900 [Buddleja alternifolia]|uniref:Gnk2-homologous domain-containing protein n=1 Tax=Buddleja alternifolia TaxID=168488 RepID=A0AAV6XYJ0_9LAMI|nr:hypothetical protein BUALT_Bualt03G0071900 [Buddleja alternifolia]
MGFSTSQPNCLNSAPYTNNSTYAANLNTIVSSLSNNIVSSGFYNASIGENPDRIEAMVICRGDIPLEACRVCVDITARPTLFQLQGRNFLERNLHDSVLEPTHIFSNPRLYNRELKVLLESLREPAANGGTFQKVAAGNRIAPGFQNMYALEQCTPDISADDCSECLTRAIQDIPTCCYAIIGAGILRPSCTLRFENYRFYNASMPEVRSSKDHCRQPNCLNSERYTDNSTYAANLNTIISSLSPNIGSSGFYNASIGQSPDRIEAMVLCRGDISLDACRSCVDSTAPVLVQRCSNYRDAIFWNETCMIRYSSQPIFGRLQLEPVSPNPSTTRIISNPRLYNRELIALLEGLRGPAANGGTVQKVAAGNRTAPGFQNMFALEQCTPDISADECSACLTRAIQDIPTCCYAIIGAGILRPSCTLRFENYRFYNASMPEVPQGPLPPEGGGNRTRTGVIIGASIAAFIILVVSIGTWFRKRIKRTGRENLENDEISTVESLQYDLGRIRAATNDFSDDNKLGQVPSHPAFFMASRYSPDVSHFQDYDSNVSNSMSTSKSKTVVSETTSVNEASINSDCTSSEELKDAISFFISPSGKCDGF